ncbi:HmuY family protein [Flavobacterium sp.]|uniref:HmuY family protein n=1 Tax=Flavobacterium sp. TaxID=239 RepID=UPI0028BF0C17|nr:HmuY family protein [Flavobacterium sp.]
MKKAIYFFLSAVAFTAMSCSDDETSTAETPADVAFVAQAVNITTEANTVNVAFSKATSASGTIVLNVEATNATYGTDFTTLPETVSNTITVPFASGVTSTSFTFSKLTDAIEGEAKNVKFTIASISGISANHEASNNFTVLNFNEVPMTNNTVTPAIGGNTFPNSVYIDLSSGNSEEIVRTNWELGFYSGSVFRVALNPAINKLAVKQLATTNIDEVQAEDASVTTGNYDPASAGYIDNPYGNIDGTSIAEISSNDAENKVYLVNLGQAVATTPAPGSGVEMIGADRGWKKIRILRNGNGYKLLYANIDATTHSELNISKDEAYNFSFVSLVNGSVTAGEPLKAKWDITIGTFMNHIPYMGQNISYYYPDFVTSNTLAGTRVYQVLTSESTYDAFALANVDTNKFNTTDAADRRAIGSNWRATQPSASVRTDRFYVIKDVAGNIYKLKFTAMLNGAGERGNITFEYVKL